VESDYTVRCDCAITLWAEHPAPLAQHRDTKVYIPRPALAIRDLLRSALSLPHDRASGTYLGYDGFATRVRDAHPNESAQSLESYRDRPSAGPPKSRGFRTGAVGMSFSGHLGFRPSSEARLSIDSASDEVLWPHQHGWLPWMACLITINARKHEDPIFQ